MLRDFSIALLVLVAATGAGLAANAVRTKTKIAWFPPAAVVKPASSAPAPSGDPASPTSTGAPAATPTEDPSEFIGVNEVVEHLRNGTAKFVDARNVDEYNAGRLRGALHLPSGAAYASINNVIDYVIPDELVIVYCGGGNCEASHIVAGVLREMGYSNVRIYKNGWEEVMASPQRFDGLLEGAGP